ncbi:MAG: type II secretion system protein [Oligoflexus sp.]
MKFCRYFAKKENQRGFGLIELSIGVGILGLVGFIIMQIFDQVGQSRYRIEALSTRDALSMRLKRVVSKSNLLYSAKTFPGQGNLELLNCIDGNANTLCQATNQRAAVSFQLGYPSQDGGRIVAGSEQQPVRYNHNGGVCRTDVTCQSEFEAKAYFSAACQNQAPTCPEALIIRVRYQIRNISLKGQPLIPSSPPDEEFAVATRGVIPINFSSTSFQGACPPFSVLSSIDSRGELRCACQPGSQQTGTRDGQPICTPRPAKCPNNQTHRLIGFTPTMDPICVPRPRWRCQRISTEAVCQGIVQGIELGPCFAEKSSPNDKKGGTSTGIIKCSQNQHTCCTEI